MPPAFHPGWRFSALDGVVLVVGIVATVGLIWYDGGIAFVIGFTLIHFFLFCNVVRMARPLELLWAAGFVALCVGTIAFDWPSWLGTTVIALGLTLVFVGIELRKPSYHGVGWRLLNPNLPNWWEAHCRPNGASDGSQR